MTAATAHFFAPCPRGLEAVLAQELGALEASAIKAADGGVHFAGPFALAYRANLESRIASRILWQVANVSYKTEDDIYKATLGLPWQQWFDVGQTIRVNLSAVRSPLKSLDFTTLRIKDAVCDAFRAKGGARPSVNTQAPDVRIHAFLTAERLTLYLDTSGEPLFKRGYRTVTGEAPLRENLAAGIVKLSGWDTREALLDPMCGSGTLLIEAALIALNIAPGARRRFAFEKLKNFDAREWENAKRAAASRESAPADLPPIFGADLYGDELKSARENIAATGLADRIQLKQANVLELPAPASSGVIVTNPPYGVRLSGEDELSEFYPQLGNALKQRFAGWRAYILTGDPQLPKLIRLAASKRTVLFNGALECRLLEYKVVAGSMRREKPARQQS